MIFVTVGAQMPFDRLVRAVDEWALERGRDDIFAQVGPTDYAFRSGRSCRSLAGDEFFSTLEASSAVVAHAGMGTIIDSLRLNKPILVMPRKGSLQETRNEHQSATAHRLLERGLVHVAWDEEELRRKLDTIDGLPPSSGLGPRAEQSLLDEIKDFIWRSDDT